MAIKTTETPSRFPADVISLSDELSACDVHEICKLIDAKMSGALKNDPTISQHATPNSSAVRQYEDAPRDTELLTFRQSPFRRDARRIGFSKAYKRLGGKTQACTAARNPHITNRLTHTERVSFLSRDIAAVLGANEDLAEAIALGHDLGHTPFGHHGEILITQAVSRFHADALKILGVFKHNIQSLHVVDRTEGRTGFKKGTGLNLTDQVRHGILSHDGEKDAIKSEPNLDLAKKPENIQKDIKKYLDAVIKASGEKDDPVEAFNCVNNTVSIKPATLEASIVRMVDVLHACAEDLEDMISLGIIGRKHIPIEVASVLGSDSANIIHTLINDLLIHSFNQPYITYSQRIGEILNQFKRKFLYPQYKIINSWPISAARDPRISRNEPDILDRMIYLFENAMRIFESSNPAQFSDSPVLNFREERDELNYRRKIEALLPQGTPVLFYHLVEAVDYISGFSDETFFYESDRMKR